MSAITYLHGDMPVCKGAKDNRPYICNDIGAWGRGFVLAVSKKWDEPEAAYRQWHSSGKTTDGMLFALGAVQLVPVTEQISVANMIGQRGIYAGAGEAPIRYEAVEACLLKLADIAEAMAASVHMPRIGCGLAGGKWEKIAPLIEKTLLASAVEVYIYDFD